MGIQKSLRRVPVKVQQPQLDEWINRELIPVVRDLTEFVNRLRLPEVTLELTTDAVTPSYGTTSTYQACDGTYRPPRWDDLRSPATAINPTGAAGAATVDQDTGHLVFANATTQVCSLMVQMPHAWRAGSRISPHVHWEKTTSASGNVTWQLEYKHSALGGVKDVAYTTLTASTAVAGTPDTNTAGQHLLTSFGTIDTTGWKLSDMIELRLSRLGADGADTYGGSAWLKELDIHMLLEGDGSGLLYTNEPQWAPRTAELLLDVEQYPATGLMGFTRRFYVQLEGLWDNSGGDAASTATSAFLGLVNVRTGEVVYEIEMTTPNSRYSEESDAVELTSDLYRVQARFVGGTTRVDVVVCCAARIVVRYE